VKTNINEKNADTEEKPNSISDRAFKRYSKIRHWRKLQEDMGHVPKIWSGTSMQVAPLILSFCPSRVRKEILANLRCVNLFSTSQLIFMANVQTAPNC